MSAPTKKSSTVSQEKDLMLDKDMEKDTWNFKSMTDDDPMDFGFGSPAKNKNNAFKMDMGFDLDGDFGNLSSFKMDMPDFDFSSPSKKTTKTKESTDDRTSGNSKQKKSPFAFSYDFDALDDYDLGTSPAKGNQTRKKTMDCEEITAKRKIDKSDALDFGPDLPITRQAATIAKTDAQEKASAEKEKQNAKTTDAMVLDSSTHSSQATFESTEKFEAVESPQGPRIRTSITHTMSVQPQSINTSPLKTSYSIVEEMDEPCPSNETAAPSPIRASETAHTAVDRETTYRADIQDLTRRTFCDRDAGKFQTTLSGKISPETGPSQTSQVQDSSSKLPLDPSQSVLGINDMKDMQNKDSGLIRSKFFMKPEKPQSYVLESTPIQAKIQPVTQERIGSNLNRTSDRRHDFNHALSGSKSKTSSTELVITNSRKNAANVNPSSSHEKIIHKDHSNAKTVENAAGLMDQLKLQAKNTTREKSILQINRSSKPDAFNLTQKLSKHLSSGAESFQNSRLASIERPRLGNIMSDLRTVKAQRTLVINKDQPSSAVQPDGSSYISKETDTEAPVSKSSEIQHIVRRDKTQILHCPSSLKRKADEDADISLKPQLKRFSMSPQENSHRSVEKLTHRNTQGKESRIDNNTTKEFVKESPRTESNHQVINMANLDIPITENTDNIEKAEAYTEELENICNNLKKKHEEAKESNHQVINMANLDIPITENTDNIEKAEAYTKELENISNNLKKKHEEAKELLVRAVINNNKLLMLNHPLYDEKIRMVQKFATKLTLRDT